MPSYTRSWRKHVCRLFGSRFFFRGLSCGTLPLWARVVNAWLGLETPKAATILLLSGKMGKTAGWFANKSAEAEAQADLLRRLSFAVWAGEQNQYVGALQGLLIDRVVAGFKYGLSGEKEDPARWVVQVQSFLCVRVLAVRVAPVHLTALWPIAMAELQRILLNAEQARPDLLLAACQLVDTLLAAHPDDFSAFQWMFVPNPQEAPPQGPPSALAASASVAPIPAPGPTSVGSSPLPLGFPSFPPSPSAHGACDCSASFHVSSRSHIGFSALLTPLCAPASRRSPMDHGAASGAAIVDAASGAACGACGASVATMARRSNSRHTGLLRPSEDGRRRPLLGMQTLLRASDLAPFAEELSTHLAVSALHHGAADLDFQLVSELQYTVPIHFQLVYRTHNVCRVPNSYTVPICHVRARSQSAPNVRLTNHPPPPNYTSTSTPPPLLHLPSRLTYSSVAM